MISYSVDLTISARSGSGLKPISSPNSRTRGGSPARKCRSEPLRSKTCVKYGSMSGKRQPSSRRRNGRGHARHVGRIALELLLVVGVAVGVVRVDLLGVDRLQQRLIQ